MLISFAPLRCPAVIYFIIHIYLKINKLYLFPTCLFLKIKCLGGLGNEKLIWFIL